MRSIWDALVNFAENTSALEYKGAAKVAEATGSVAKKATKRAATKKAAAKK